MQDRPLFLHGIEDAPPEVADAIRQKARRYVRWRRPPIVTAPQGFVALDEANEQVQNRWAPWPTIHVLTARGLVQRCYRSTDGADGVTKESLDAEIQWRRSASTWDHVRRLVRATNEGV